MVTQPVDPTRIGRVRQVLGASVTVDLDPEMAGITPIYQGRLLRIGQIGSLIRLPQGLVDVLGTVTLVGIGGSVADAGDPATRGDRWLEAQLIGEVDRASGAFQRGVASYPGLDDPVCFTTPDQLQAVFPAPGADYLRLGRLAANEDVPVAVDAQRLVVRHAAVVGSTGAGKTSAVASLLQAFARGGWKGANIVVVDPHGEYGAALSGFAGIRSVMDSGPNGLRVPYWALPAIDIARIFAGTAGGGTFASRFSELVAEERRRFVASVAWIDLEPSVITSDTPVPFDVNAVWLQLDSENRETRMNKGDPSTACLLKAGNSDRLQPAEYEPYNPAGAAPHKGPLHGVYGTTPDLLRLGLLDPRLKFFQEPRAVGSTEDPLVQVMLEWLGGTNMISVLDFSGVPLLASDLAIGVVLNLLFETVIHSSAGANAIGKANPVLVVLEEAHRYLGDAATALTRESANRIAREGRKYGIGLMLVSQRPTELPRTALAQAGTIIALRLSNAEDQGAIRAALPDTVAGLAAVLPTLRTGEAIVSGEAVVLPARTIIDMPSPQPSAEDPSLDSWKRDRPLREVADSIASWRGVPRGPAA